MTADGQLIRKYRITRMDGSNKHRECDYFVLDLTHDPHALEALHRYAQVCASSHPRLSVALHQKHDELSQIQQEGDTPDEQH